MQAPNGPHPEHPSPARAHASKVDPRQDQEARQHARKASQTKQGELHRHAHGAPARSRSPNALYQPPPLSSFRQNRQRASGMRGPAHRGTPGASAGCASQPSKCGGAGRSHPLAATVLGETHDDAVHASQVSRVGVLGVQDGLQPVMWEQKPVGFVPSETIV